MGDLLIVTVDNQEYKFKPLPNQEEKCRIRSEMANMLKNGYDELLDIEDAIQKSYQRHLKFNEELFGKEKFGEMNKRYLELFRLRREAGTDEERQVLDVEQDELAKQINDNRHFSRFIDFTNTKDFLEDLATMRVTCISHQDYELKKLDEEKERELIILYNQKKNLARLSRKLKS